MDFIQNNSLFSGVLGGSTGETPAIKKYFSRDLNGLVAPSRGIQMTQTRWQFSWSVIIMFKQHKAIFVGI